MTLRRIVLTLEEGSAVHRAEITLPEMPEPVPENLIRIIQQQIGYQTRKLLQPEHGEVQ